MTVDMIKEAMEKAGQMAGHVYDVMLRQIYVEAIVFLVIGLIIFVTTAIVVVNWSAAAAKGLRADEVKYGCDSDFEDRVLAYMGPILVSLAGGVISIAMMTANLLRVLNPEYYVYMSILEAFK